VRTYYCPYLKRNVVLTDERYELIMKQHPELLPEYEDALKETINDPDTVRKSMRFQNALLFTKFFDNIRAGKYAVAVVISDFLPDPRDWIITAYIARKITQGGVEWQKK
jgi:hypothetical protein